VLDLFRYGFAVRGMEAGVVVALVAPLIGTFLVLRRYSLIADTLANVSLAGITLGLLLGINPILAALVATAAASLGIEKLRLSKRIYGESSLALFCSGSLALATILLSVGRGFNTNLFNYLFGSIVTVTQKDVDTILILAAVVTGALALFYKELVYITFDEDSAQVSGLPVRRLNMLLIVLSALTITLSIPIIGVLLIAALVVIPAVAALQLRRGFAATLFWAEAISLFSVVTGMLASFYLDLSSGGTIVLVMLGVFLILLPFGKSSGDQPAV